METTPAKVNGRWHNYHAEATLLSANLQLPIQQRIEPQGYLHLPSEGGYQAQRLGEYRQGGVIGYRSGYTQVAGNLDTKPGHGWSTLTTTVLEGLNVLEVLTADRVVAQVSTEYPLVGYVPGVTFLGTRFENLRIAGHPVELDLDLDLFGEKPADDQPYTRSTALLNRLADRRARLHASAGGPDSGHPALLEEFEKRYNLLRTGPDAYNRLPSGFSESAPETETVECSLVHQARGGYPGRSYGHVIDVPHFGRIYLATLRLTHSDPHPESKIPRKTLIELTMIDLKLGCIASGTGSVGTTKTNGVTIP